MKNFKPGQKVVFSTARLRLPREVYTQGSEYNFPAEKEIVTVVKMGSRDGFWIIREYLLSKKGAAQCLCEIALFPVEEISKSETEKITSALEREFDSVEIDFPDYKPIKK